MKNIILGGIQGSGKGTQANLLLKKFGSNIKYFEAGGMLRILQSKPNTIGDYVGSQIDNGKIIPDAFMVKLFELFLLSINDEGMLLDGFPRKPGETDEFLKIIKQYNKEFIWVVLDISKETAVNRLTSRYLCKCGAILNSHLHDISQCHICGAKDVYQRLDDMAMEKIETRFARYNELCIPTITKLEKLGLVRHVNGEQPIENVLQDIVKIIEE